MTLRHEVWPWNAITAQAEIVVAGLPETGAAPTVAIQRDSDGYWLANLGGGWASGFATNLMVHVSSGNRNGMYEYSVPTVRLIADAGGYNMLIQAAAVVSMPGPLYEHVRIDLVHPVGALETEVDAASRQAIVVAGIGAIETEADAASRQTIVVAGLGAIETETDAASRHTAMLSLTNVVAPTPGTLGDYLRRTLGLRQRHNRTIYLTFNASDQPLTGSVLIYDSALALNGDTDPWGAASGKYDFTATYDASNRLTEYVSEEVV